MIGLWKLLLNESKWAINWNNFLKFWSMTCWLWHHIGRNMANKVNVWLIVTPFSHIVSDGTFGVKLYLQASSCRNQTVSTIWLPYVVRSPSSEFWVSVLFFLFWAVRYLNCCHLDFVFWCVLIRQLTGTHRKWKVRMPVGASLWH